MASGMVLVSLLQDSVKASQSSMVSRHFQSLWQLTLPLVGEEPGCKNILTQEFLTADIAKHDHKLSYRSAHAVLKISMF